MARDHFIDLMESGGEWWTASWRCINCGYVLDPVLEQNRLKQRAEMVTAPVPVSPPQAQVPEEEQPALDVAA
jgi:hypothetical protein